MNLLADLHRAAHALGHHDNEVGAARQARAADAVDHVPLEVQLPLGHQHRGGAHGDAHVQRQKARVAAHDLYHGAALVALHGVAQLVDAVDGGVTGGVKADGVIGAADVVVDGGRHAHHRDAQPGQRQRPAEGAVAADGHNAVQPQHLAGGDRAGAALFGHEILAAGGVEDGAAPGDDVAHAGGVQLNKIAVDKSLPAAADADALDSTGYRCAHHGANRRVHARGIAAAGQYADAPDRLFHV